MEELGVLNNEGGHGIFFPEMEEQEAWQQEWGEGRDSSPEAAGKKGSAMS